MAKGSKLLFLTALSVSDNTGTGVFISSDHPLRICYDSLYFWTQVEPMTYHNADYIYMIYKTSIYTSMCDFIESLWKYTNFANTTEIMILCRNYEKQMLGLCKNAVFLFALFQLWTPNPVLL